MPKNLLITENPTMPSNVGIFNIPPLLTCYPSKWCKEHCYALHRRFLWPSVKKAMMWRYKQSLKKDFVSKMIEELKRRKSIKRVRIHITGDFYSEEYIYKWAEIAKNFSNIIFRTNTKQIRFFPLMKKIFPINVVIRESTDVSRPTTNTFPQAAIEGVKGSEKFYKCLDDCQACNFYCWRNRKINICLKEL